MEWIRLSQDKAAIAKNEEVLDGLRDAQAARNAEMAPKLAETVGLPSLRSGPARCAARGFEMFCELAKPGSQTRFAALKGFSSRP